MARSHACAHLLPQHCGCNQQHRVSEYIGYLPSIRTIDHARVTWLVYSDGRISEQWTRVYHRRMLMQRRPIHGSVSRTCRTSAHRDVADVIDERAGVATSVVIHSNDRTATHVGYACIMYARRCCTGVYRIKTRTATDRGAPETLSPMPGRWRF